MFMEKLDIFTEEQERVIKLMLAEIWTGRGKVVEDLSKEINEKMFPLTEKQVKEIDNAVEAFVYGGGVQEELPVPERLQFGLDWVIKALL